MSIIEDLWQSIFILDYDSQGQLSYTIDFTEMGIFQSWNFMPLPGKI